MRSNPFHPVRWLALLALILGLASAHPTAQPATQAASQSPNLPSKVGDLKWHTFLGEANDDVANAITLSPSGDIVLAGESRASWGNPLRSYEGGNFDAFVARLDENGNLKWHTFLGGAGSDYAAAIALSPSGDIVLAGTSDESWGNPLRPYVRQSDAFVARLDANGNLKWHTFLGGTSDDAARAIALSPSGDIMLSGYSKVSWGNPLRPYGGGDYDAFVARLDANGNLKWHTFLGGTYDDAARAIALSPSGDIVLAGNSNGVWGSSLRSYERGLDAWVVRLDANGNLKWHTFLGGTSDDVANAITLSPLGDIVLAGNSYVNWGNPLRPHANGFLDVDAFVARLDANGNLKWHTFFGGVNHDLGAAITLDSWGDIVLAGYSGSWGNPLRPHGGGSYDAFVARLDVNGNLKWHTFLGGTYDDAARAIVLSPSGDIVLAGYSGASWGKPLRLHGGAWDAFVARLEAESAIKPISIYLTLVADQLFNATEPPPTVAPTTPIPPTPTPTPTPDPCASSDCREPNNSFEQAAQIRVNEPVLGSVNADGDVNDYYRVNLQAGKRYNVRLNFSGNVNLDLYIYDPDQLTIIESQNDGAVPEEVEVQVGRDGGYYVLVSAFAGAGPQPYELRVSE